MSCRVIGLEVENAALGVVANYLRQTGLNLVVCLRIETRKNLISRDICAKVDFVENEGRRFWTPDVQVIGGHHIE